jgi:uncharacterized phiE125 gp8 family phage protein
MGLVLVTPPTAYAVTLTEAKAQCRVTSTDEDGVIQGYIAAATSYVEKYTGTSIMAQTWKLVLDGWSDCIKLPNGPVSSVTSVKYLDTAGVEQTLAADQYTADLASSPARVVRKTTTTYPPALNEIASVNVTYVAGYTTLPDTKADLRNAILLLIGQWHANREAVNVGNIVSEFPHAVEALLTNHRCFS